MTKEEQIEIIEIIEKIQMNLDSLKGKVDCTKTSMAMTETKLWYARNIIDLANSLRNEFLRVL